MIKQVDSTVWHLKTPYAKRIITCEYTDTGKIVTEIHNKNKDTINHTTISYYNNDNKIVKVCYDNIYTSKKNCIEYFYIYENNKLTKTIEKNSFGDIFVKTYSYNEKGLLKEEQKLRNDKITNLIRYYYE